MGKLGRFCLQKSIFLNPSRQDGGDITDGQSSENVHQNNVATENDKDEKENPDRLVLSKNKESIFQKTVKVKFARDNRHCFWKNPRPVERELVSVDKHQDTACTGLEIKHSNKFEQSNSEIVRK